MTSNQANIAASVRQRLLNLSREQNEDFQLILIRFGLERMLYRLSQSAYRNQFVLKGAMLFQIWSNESHRPTRDIDFLGQGEPSETRFQNLYKELCGIEVEEDGLVFDSASVQVATMKEDEKYQGIRIKLNAFLASARIPIQIDIGFGDSITPAPIEIQYPTILEFAAPSLTSYPRETVVAEKFQAMVMLGIGNSRMKDFFDIWRLSKQFAFDGDVLSQALTATFDRRETEVPSTNPLALTEEFSGDSQKKIQWNAFIKKSKLDIAQRTFGEVVDDLAEFLMPPAIATHQKVAFTRHWSPGGPWK